MKIRKVLLVCVLFLFLNLFLTACGCQHVWNDATCITPKTCDLCGETEGEANGHSYVVAADCVRPMKCAHCDSTEGEPLGHNYLYGSCLRCRAEDPDYVDLQKFGFTKMYGMNAWLNVTGYNFSKKRVLVDKSFGFDFKIFEGNYWQRGDIPEEKIAGVTDVSTSLFSSVKTTPYTVLSNDVIQYYGGNGLGPLTITGRAVSGNMLILKTYDEAKSGDYREYWYVPADLLDFSTVTEGDKKNSYYVYFK